MGKLKQKIKEGGKNRRNLFSVNN